MEVVVTTEAISRAKLQSTVIEEIIVIVDHFLSFCGLGTDNQCERWIRVIRQGYHSVTNLCSCQFSYNHYPLQFHISHLFDILALHKMEPIHVLSSLAGSVSENLFLCVLMAIFPCEPGLASFVEAKDDGSGGDNWSYTSCKTPVKSLPPTVQHPTVYRQMPFLSPNQQCQSTEGKFQRIF